jgi:hypothetical protein
MLNMKYDLIEYEVWGNKRDGFEINDCFRVMKGIEIDDNDTDKDIVKKLKEVGYLKNTVRMNQMVIERNSESMIEFYERKDYKPSFNLERVEW